MIAAMPTAVDPGLLALGDAVEDLKRAATSCRSTAFKARVVALWTEATKLRDAFCAHETQERADGPRGDV